MEPIAGNNRQNSTSTSSPARSSSINSEDIFKDGLIDLNQLNYILRNPELPKSRHKISSILKQYNQEKCRAITLHRINYKLRNYQNIDDNNCNLNNTTSLQNNDCIDLDELSEYEVKLSQLPQELLVSILGETFAKYQIQMNNRNQQNINTNITSNRSESVLNQNEVCVKQEVLSDVESDCEILSYQLNNNNINELKLQLQKLISDYESVEKEEKSVLNELQIVTKELENKLSALRECIGLCEIFKEQNLSLTQKQNQLKTKKFELKREIKVMKDKLIELNNSHHNPKTNHQNNCVNTTINYESTSEPIVRSVSTSNQNNERQQNTNVSNDPKIAKITLSSETNKKKRKVIPNNISKNIRKENEIIKDNEINAVNKCRNDLINSSVEGTNSKLRKLSITRKDQITKDSNLRCNRKNVNSSPTNNQKSIQIEANDVMQIDDNENTLKERLQNNGLQTDKTQSTRNDWRDNYVNLVFNPLSAESSSSKTSLAPMKETLTRTSNPPINQNRMPSSPSVVNRNKRKNDWFNRNSQNNYEYEHNVLHDIRSVKDNFVPHVSSLYTFNNQLFVGFQCGSINRYLIEENGLKFLNQYPNLCPKFKSKCKYPLSIDALYYSEKYNYLYCGTRNGLFAHLNNNSNKCDFDTVELYDSITCFESSATILYIGSIDGIIHRFGLMSNKMINNFKCLNESIIGLKLINDLTEQNRIIVCGKNETSIRNSVDGSLLHTLDNNGMRSEFVGSDLYANKIIVCTNIKAENLHRIYVYDENVRSVTNNFVHNSRVFLMTKDENCFYIYTVERELFCFDCHTFSFKWITNVRINKNPTSIAVSNKRVILGMPFGKVVIIVPEQNSPIICKCHNCDAKFPRISDIFNHFNTDHAIPFCKIVTNYNNLYYCPWIGCNMKIKKIKNMIVEHLKSHVN